MFGPKRKQISGYAGQLSMTRWQAKIIKESQKRWKIGNLKT